MTAQQGMPWIAAEGSEGPGNQIAPAVRLQGVGQRRELRVAPDERGLSERAPPVADPDEDWRVVLAALQPCREVLEVGQDPLGWRR
jgi:hypothetical protein